MSLNRRNRVSDFIGLVIKPCVMGAHRGARLLASTCTKYVYHKSNSVEQGRHQYEFGRTENYF